MSALQQEHYLLSNRDEVESGRLDFQHNIITKLRDGRVLDPAIPKQNITSVADIGTGTGIWLQDLAAELSENGITNFELTGFDISSALFPKTPKPGFHFVTSDILKGFAEEYHGKFDVVHIRLFVIVLTSDQIKPAAETVVKLLKPGGYLQWDEMDLHLITGDNAPPMDLDLCREENELIFEFMKSQGWSLSIVSDISTALKSCPVTDVKTTDFTSVSHQRTTLRSTLREWVKQGFGAFLPPMLWRTGKVKNEEDVKKAIEDYWSRVDEMGRRGFDYVMPLVTLTARKV